MIRVRGRADRQPPGRETAVTQPPPKMESLTRMLNWLNLPRPWIFLAPMAGVADWAFREVCYEFGAEVAVSPLVPAHGLAISPRAYLDMFGARHGARPFIAQIFGHNPEQFRKSARVISDSLPVWGIDINMGCPAREVVNSGNGSALLRDPDLAVEIVAATRAGTDLPVSVKIRTGWDRVVAPDLAPRLERAGAQAIFIHGRTREQLYGGTVDRATIGEVKRATTIPVVGNGNVVSVDSARSMLAETGVDGVMIGRAAMGAPWLFAELAAALKGEGEHLGTGLDKAALVRKHVRLAFESEGDMAALTIRKHLMAYTRGYHASASLRRLVQHLETRSDVDTWVDSLERAMSVHAAEPESAPV